MTAISTILTDIWKVVKASPIDALNGGIYKRTRPTNSDLEDCVISIIPGTAAKFIQNGALYVKIFYKALFIDNTYYEDSVNALAKETLLINLSAILLKNKNYSFDIASREVYTEYVEELHQYYAILKINFVNV